MENMNPVQQWFALLRNLSKFAEKPSGLDKKFDPLFEVAQTRGLHEEEQLKYFRAMISEQEKRGIANAYYNHGFRDGKKEGEDIGIEKGIEKGAAQEREKNAREKAALARSMRDDGVDVSIIAKHFGFSKEEIKAL